MVNDPQVRASSFTIRYSLFIIHYFLIMYLSNLSLNHFRNYQSLSLDFSERITLLQGQNAQGKTNLLEAIFFLATSKPVHAQSEREVVDCQGATGSVGAHDQRVAWPDWA